jgi:hypothetical protein
VENENQTPPKPSALNATKHAILSRCSTKYDWVDGPAILEQLKPEFEPITPMKQLLLEQIALTFVRLGRCARCETEILKEGLNPPIKKGLLDDDLFAPTVVHKGEPATLGGPVIERLDLVYTRYEPRLISRLGKLLEQIKSLKR